jgi:hypothetical protein
MTAILAAPFGRYAIVVADMRVGKRQKDGTVVVTDDALKINRTQYGLFSGAGAAGLIEGIGQHINDTKASIADSLAAAEYVRADFKRYFAAEREMVDRLGGNNEFVCTYFGPAVKHDLVMPTGGNRLRDPDSDQVRVAATVPGSPEFKFMAVEVGFPWLLGDVPLDKWRRDLIDLFLAKQSLPPANPTQEALRENIDANVRAASAVIQAIAERSESVSPSVQTGVHMAPLTLTVPWPYKAD